MPTVDKVFTFDTDLESLVDDGSSAKLTVAWNGSEGSPSAGNMLFTWGTTGASTEEELAKTPAPGVTWESWGVPAGAVVTHLQFVGGKKRLTTATLLTAASFRVELTSGGVAATGADLVPTTAMTTTVDGSWQDLPGGTFQTVTAGLGDSTDLIRIFFHWTATASAGTPDITQKFDSLTFRMTYTPLVSSKSPAIGFMVGTGW